MTMMDSGSQSGSRAEEVHAGTDLDALHVPQSQEATAVPNNHCIGDLITGPRAATWSRMLVRKHLDCGSRLALFRTCTAARDLMLVTAKLVRTTMHVNKPADMAKLRHVRTSLLMRGKLRTKLVLYASNSSMLLFAVGVLEAGTAWVDELTLSVPDAEEPMYSSTIATIGQCCPNVLTLKLEKAPKELPSPSYFPRLEVLRITTNDSEAVEPLFPIAAPYIKQSDHVPGPSLLLFTPGNVASHLMTLHLPVTLNDTLLGLLLGGAPALEELYVGSIRLETDTHVQSQVQWEELWVHELHLSSLARLPVAPNLEIWFNPSEPDPAAPDEHYGWPTVVCDIVGGGEAEAAARLRDVWMNSDDMVLMPLRSMPIEGQPGQLRVGMDLLRTWSAEDTSDLTRITLAKWTMSSELMLELHRLPRFSTLGLEKVTWLPGPLLYTTLLQRLPDSFHTIIIQPDGLTQEQLERMCLGAPARRETELIIKVHGVPDQVQAIQLRMQQALLPNVTVQLYV